LWLAQFGGRKLGGGGIEYRHFLSIYKSIQKARLSDKMGRFKRNLIRFSANVNVINTSA
jgi:hypothetical protein